MNTPQNDSSLIQTGNAELDSLATRGWFIGSFLGPDGGIRNTQDIEVKWGVHQAGEARDEWVTGETRTTLAILVSGEFVMEFRDKTIDLSAPGDYVMWDPGVDHKWHAVKDCTLLTVRWPSN